MLYKARCALAVMAVVLAGAARAEKGLNDGIYRDAAGGQHTWTVERSHRLMWDEKPYTPAGIVFHSAYLRAPAPETLRKDHEELDRLKAAGIGDVWVEPGRGLLENSTEQIQALVDSLESRGFRYGLRVGDRSREPLVGYSPTLPGLKVPVARLQPGARESWRVSAPRGRRLVYNLVEQTGPKIQNFAIASGEVVVERDQALIEVQLKRTRLLGKSAGMLLVVPEIQVEPEDLGSFGELWTGMPAYAERLSKRLLSVKFGPGLRFVLDPFAAGDGTIGQEDMVFPSSDAFRKSFREWLGKRSGFHTVNSNWRLTDRRVPDLDVASRIIPMWSRNDPPEGDGWLFDPVDKQAYRCIPRQSHIWDDLENFRAETLKRWMNTLTSTLKQEGLNVPMLFSWGAYHPIFNNTPSPSGYDGLGAQLYGASGDIAPLRAAYALAQAEESDRNTWLIATRVAGPPDVTGSPTPVAGGAEIRKIWDGIREAGFRGAYVDPEQCPDATSLARELSGAIASSTGLDARPKVCFFPMPLAVGDRLTRLSNGVWWLPSGASARVLRFGDSIIGYQIDRPLGDDHTVTAGTVLWSTTGKQDVTFYIDRLSPFSLYDSAGLPVKMKPRVNELKLSLTGEPLIATGLDVTAIFPFELALQSLKEFDQLLTLAEAQKLNSASLRTIYKEAKEGLSPGSAATIYGYIAPHVTLLRQEMVPYVWLEGERSASHNWTGAAFRAGCSSGSYLKLDRKNAPISGVFKAEYSVEVRRDASYDLWIAGRVPGRPGVSPLIWQLDEEPPVVASAPTVAGPDYVDGMAWFSLGRMTLKTGRHSLVLVVPERSAGPEGRFLAGIDAVVVSREPFHPKGIERPPIQSTARAGPAPTAAPEAGGRKGERAK